MTYTTYSWRILNKEAFRTGFGFYVSLDYKKRSGRQEFLEPATQSETPAAPELSPLLNEM
jgi:hypothetical protein